MWLHVLFCRNAVEHCPDVKALKTIRFQLHAEVECDLQRQLECQARLSACADGAVAAPTPRLCGHAQATPAGSFAHSPHVRVQSRVLPQHRLSVLACPCCVGSDVSLAQAGPTRTS